jgi:hypothetical protein
MSDETPTYGMPRIGTAAGAITPAEAEELRELYSELPIAAEAAGESLGTNGPLPTGMRFERFMELEARIVEIVLRIEEILAR